jgi:hypothetical protein
MKSYLTLGGSTDQTRTILENGDCGRSSTVTLRVLNNTRLGAFHDGNARVGGTKIDTNGRVTVVQNIIKYMVLVKKF